MKELVEQEGKHTALLLSVLLRIWLVSFLIYLCTAAVFEHFLESTLLLSYVISYYS